MAIKPVSSGTAPQRIFEPTPAEIKSSYTSAVNEAFEKKTAVRLKEAPRGAKKSEGIDIDPKGEDGANRIVFNIGGKLFLRQIDVVEHAKPTWYSVGFAPVF